MFQQIVQTSESALHTSAHGHLILPAVSHSLKRDGVNVIGDEATMRPRSVAQTLADHSSQHGLQPFPIAISVFPHTLERNANAHLPACNGDGSVE